MTLFQRSPLVPSWMVSITNPEIVEEYFCEAQKVFGLFQDENAVSDAVFDRVFPRILRKFSKTHWTPVSVAIRAVSLLVQSPTYHGFGGDFPDGFKRLLRETHGTGALELWVKEHA